MSFRPTIGQWMQADPTGAKYIDGPNLYQFVHSNPVNHLDPTGLQDMADLYGPQDPESRWKRQQAQNEQYNTDSAYRAQVEAERQRAHDFDNSLKSTDNFRTTPNEVAWEWAQGTGPAVRYFKDGDLMTEELKKGEGVRQVRDRINSNLRDYKATGNPFYLEGTVSYSGTFWRYLKDYFWDVPTSGANDTCSLIGGYIATFVMTVDGAKVTVRINVSNITSLSSGTRNPITRKPILADQPDPTKLFGNKRQYFEWTETLP